MHIGVAAACGDKRAAARGVATKGLGEHASWSGPGISQPRLLVISDGALWGPSMFAEVFAAQLLAAVVLFLATVRLLIVPGTLLFEPCMTAAAAGLTRAGLAAARRPGGLTRPLTGIPRRQEMGA